MSKGIYKFAGIGPDPENDGKLNSKEEIIAFLSGTPEGAKLLEMLATLATKANTPVTIIVTDITALTATQLDALRCGDQVIKRDSTGDHCYTVSFMGTTGRCLTYCDCENVETVAYEKREGVWTYDSTDVTHIAAEVTPGG